MLHMFKIIVRFRFELRLAQTGAFRMKVRVELCIRDYLGFAQLMARVIPAKILTSENCSNNVGALLVSII